MSTWHLLEAFAIRAQISCAGPYVLCVINLYMTYAVLFENVLFIYC